MLKLEKPFLNYTILNTEIKIDKYKCILLKEGHKIDQYKCILLKEGHKIDQYKCIVLVLKEGHLLRGREHGDNITEKLLFTWQVYGLP